jgi:hypothetical protein
MNNTPGTFRISPQDGQNSTAVLNVPVSEAHEIYANRRDDRVRLLLMPGSHDEYGELEQHIGMVIGFLDDALRWSSSEQRVLQERGETR